MPVRQARSIDRCGAASAPGSQTRWRIALGGGLAVALLGGCAATESSVDRARLVRDGRLLAPVPAVAADAGARTWALAGVLEGDPFVTEPGAVRLVLRDGRLRVPAEDERGYPSELVLDTASPWTVMPAASPVAETARVDPVAARLPERPDLGRVHEAVAPRLVLRSAADDEGIEPIGCTDLPVYLARPDRPVEPVLGAVPAASLRLSRDTRTDRWTLETPSSLDEMDVAAGPTGPEGTVHFVPLVDAWLPLVRLEDEDGAAFVALVDTGSAHSWVPAGSPLAGRVLHLRSDAGESMLRLRPRASAEPVRTATVGGHPVEVVIGLADLARRSWQLEIARGEWWFIDR